MKEKRYKSLLFVFFFILILLTFSPLVSAECTGGVFDRWDCGWKLIARATKSILVGSSQECFNIIGSEKTFFVPTKTDYEWNMFYSFADANEIDITSCLSRERDRIRQEVIEQATLQHTPYDLPLSLLDTLVATSTSSQDLLNKIDALSSNPEYENLILITAAYSAGLDDIQEGLPLRKESFYVKAESLGFSRDRITITDTVPARFYIDGVLQDEYPYNDISPAELTSYFDSYNYAVEMNSRYSTLYNSYLSQVREKTLELCGGTYCNLDNNGDGLCQVSESCWGTITGADDDGDGLCESGESCCGADPEGCNLANCEGTTKATSCIDGDDNGDGVCQYGEACLGDDDGDDTCEVGEACYGDDGDDTCEVGESCCAADPEGCNLDNGCGGSGQPACDEGGGDDGGDTGDDGGDGGW